MLHFTVWPQIWANSPFLTSRLVVRNRQIVDGKESLELNLPLSYYYSKIGLLLENWANQWIKNSKLATNFLSSALVEIVSDSLNWHFRMSQGGLWRIIYHFSFDLKLKSGIVVLGLQIVMMLKAMHGFLSNFPNYSRIFFYCWLAVTSFYLFVTSHFLNYFDCVS